MEVSMSAYCAYCNGFVEIVDGKCADCGRRPATQPKGKHFITGNAEEGYEPVNLEFGEKLNNRFTIKRLLGTGRMSAVYLANDSIRSCDVALKVIKIDSSNQHLVKQFQHEVALHARIADHRYVIAVYDAHFAPYGGIGLLLISMEYADGGSLREWLAENRDNLQKRRTDGLLFFRQACRGVGTLHEAGIVHGDIKPENILIVNGTAKISDLGISRFINGHLLEGVPACSGTPAYRSPEQFTAPHPDDIDERSDIYSLGAVYYEIMSLRCRPPFGGTDEQLCERHLHVAPARLEGVSENEARVAVRCLMKKPEDRYGSIEKLLDSLDGGNGDDDEQDGMDDEDDLSAEVDELFERACSHIEAGNLSEAARLCRQILKRNPDHEHAGCVVQEIEQRYQQAEQIFANIERDINSQSLDQLLSLGEEAVRLYPDHPRGQVVLADLASRAREYREVMQEGVCAVAEGIWQKAQACFERAGGLNHGSPVVSNAIGYITSVQQEISTVNTQVDAAIHEGDEQRAISIAGALDEYIEQVKTSVLRLIQRNPEDETQEIA